MHDLLSDARYSVARSAELRQAGSSGRAGPYFSDSTPRPFGTRLRILPVVQEERTRNMPTRRRLRTSTSNQSNRRVDGRRSVVVQGRRHLSAARARVLRRQRRRHWRFPRPDRKAGLHPGPGRHGHLAVAVFPVAACEMTATTSPTIPASIRPTEICADFKAFLREAKQTRSARDHGNGDEPHLRPARVVPEVTAGQARRQVARFLRLERHRRAISAKRGSFSRTLKRRIGPGIRSPKPISGIVSIIISPI